MNYHLNIRSWVLLFAMFLMLALLTACAGEQTQSPEERQAAAAATVAAARATEVAVAQIQAELTRAAIPSDTPTPIETPTPSPSPTATESNAISREIVAAEGGSIELSDGTRLEIPPGALKQDGTVSLARLDALPSEAGNLDGLHYQAYEITTPIHTLAVSATIRVSYQDLPMDDALSPDAVFAAHWDGADWQVMEGTIVTNQKTLSFTTGHFSIFSLFALPSISKFGNRLNQFLGEKLGIGAPAEARGWLDIVNNIKPPPAGSWEIRTYQLTESPFIAVPHFAGNYLILVDPIWYDAQPLVKDLPQDKRNLLAAAFLGHEMAHHVHGDSDFAKSIATGISRTPENVAMALAPFAKLWIALTQGDLQPFFSAIQEGYRAQLQLSVDAESRADASGYGWVKDSSPQWFQGKADGGDTGIETILITAHFFSKLPTNPEDTSHPIPANRANKTRELVPKGTGGLYGKVSGAGDGIAGIRITYEKTGAWTETDAQGLYLLAPIAAGNVSLVLSKAGCQKQQVNTWIPDQDMAKSELQFNCVIPPTAKPTRISTPSPSGLITDFEAWGTWKRGDEAWGTFTQSKEQVFSGSYSGKLTYSFPATSNNYLVFRRTIPIGGQPTALKIMVYGDGSSNFLNAWVQDANSQLWQFTFGQIYHTGWQQMSAAFDVSRGWPNQAVGGSPKTVTPVFPLRFYALVLDGYREDIAFQGAVYLDDLFVGDADKFTPIPRATNTPISGVTNTPTPGATPNASIAFRADRTSLNTGECTTLRWDVDNVTAIYLDGQGVGGHESRQVCPTATQTYNLVVTRRDGSQQQVSVTIQVVGTAVTPTPLPPVGPCEAIPGESYGALSIQGSPSDRPAESHADLNLAVRGYERNNAAPQFSDYGPAVDPNGPQLPGLFGDQRTPNFTSTYQVFDWDWGCNCRGRLLNQWDVTLLGMGVNSGEVIRVPDSGRSIGSGYEVLVLYASPDRITLKYTPEDNVVSGYTIHIEDVCVEPNLLGLYQSLNQSGRGRLPALRAGQAFGRAKGGEIKVAIRDGGAFFDPRSRNDWWRGR